MGQKSTDENAHYMMKYLLTRNMGVGNTGKRGPRSNAYVCRLIHRAGAWTTAVEASRHSPYPDDYVSCIFGSNYRRAALTMSNLAMKLTETLGSNVAVSGCLDSGRWKGYPRASRGFFGEQAQLSQRPIFADKTHLFTLLPVPHCLSSSTE
jgi:hypothetical protein